ncbi:MAG: hypothetical protein LBK24_01820 [Puniceicoccales bacterium]|jgi:hypothetical protein|nr:hypothetical protein [Puniceicoccales bacterium]
MNKATLRLTRLFVTIDDLCKGKKTEQKERRGREGGLWVSEILAIQIWFNLNKCKDFKTFYRSQRRVFTPIFPKNAKLFLLYETDKTAGKDVSFHWKDKAE